MFCNFPHFTISNHTVFLHLLCILRLAAFKRLGIRYMVCVQVFRIILQSGIIYLGGCPGGSSKYNHQQAQCSADALSSSSCSRESVTPVTKLVGTATWTVAKSCCAPI